MDLQLRMPDGEEPLAAAEIRLERTLGRPCTWSFVVDARPETRGGTEPLRLRRIMNGDPAFVQAVCQGSPLGPEAFLTSGRWLTETGRVRNIGDRRAETLGEQIELQATSTRTDSDPNPFVARRRVHRIKNLKELFDGLSHVADLVDGLATDLAGCTFPESEKICVIQDGVSDWDFLAHVMAQSPNSADDDPHWHPLLLVGGVDPSTHTEGRLIITPGCKASYEAWGSVEKRVVPTLPEGTTRILFDSIQTTQPTYYSTAGQYPSVVYSRSTMPFDVDSWNVWSQADLPLFSPRSHRMIWRIVDRVYRSQVQDVFNWDTFAYYVPDGVPVYPPRHESVTRGWFGHGTVVEATKTGQWITVRLDGFEAGKDLVSVRLCTPYSGQKGTEGLHLVPEKDTRVLISWSGNFDDSLVLAGNTRWGSVGFGAPSLHLEATVTSQFEGIVVKRVGPIGIQSAASVSVDGKSTVESTGAVVFKGDGGTWKLEGGDFRTGKSF